MKTKPGIVGFGKEIVDEFIDDDVMTQAAALAFYTGLAMAPLLTVAVWVMQLFMGQAAKDRLLAAFGEVMGRQAAEPIRELLNPATDAVKSSLTLGAIVSFCILLFSATGVFSQLQAALNLVWDVKAKAGNGIWNFVRARLLSMGMLFTVLFLLMTSLVLTTALQAFVRRTGSEGGILLAILNQVVSLGLFTVLFAMLFHFIPDVRLSWRPTWIGAFISAVLFLVGRFGLAYYLGRGDYKSSYGAAVGSFMALLVWVYYSSIILLVGAEVTQVFARRNGERVETPERAVRTVKTVEELSE